MRQEMSNAWAVLPPPAMWRLTKLIDGDLRVALLAVDDLYIALNLTFSDNYPNKSANLCISYWRSLHPIVLSKSWSVRNLVQIRLC